MGMLAGNGLAVLLFALEFVLFSVSPESALAVGLPSLLFVPFCIGLVAAWVWRPLELGIGAVLLHSMSCLFLGLIIGTVVFHEGAICLVIVSPILYGGLVAGALTGRVWFRKNRDRANLCLAPVFVLAIVAEPALRSRHTSVVADEIRIAAPPARVWPHVLIRPATGSSAPAFPIQWKPPMTAILPALIAPAGSAAGPRSRNWWQKSTPDGA